MFLCRVKTSFYEHDLSIWFSISQASVSCIILTWASYLYCMLVTLSLWASCRQIDEHMPECFCKTCPKMRLIPDCTEMHIHTPSSRVLNSEAYSHYKCHPTLKSLVGRNPGGMLTFVSSMFLGSISYREITAKSGILPLLEPGDQAMANESFLIN